MSGFMKHVSATDMCWTGLLIILISLFVPGWTYEYGPGRVGGAGIIILLAGGCRMFYHGVVKDFR